MLASNQINMNLLKYYVTESMDFDKIEFIQTCAIVIAFTAFIFLAVILL